MQRSHALWGACALALLTACASPPQANRPPGQAVTQWAGRLALRVDSDQAQSFSAGFELKGNAQTGELSLYSPLGSTIAQLVWAPGDARLRSGGKERSFDSLDALTLQATGTELPVASIFRWRLACARASVRRSLNIVRFGKPVSESKFARKRSSSSARLRSAAAPEIRSVSASIFR